MDRTTAQPYTWDEILEKLEKPLDVERNMGYRDLSVIGGFARYMQTWARRGLEIINSDQVQQQLKRICTLFEGYSSLSVVERRRRIQAAERILHALRRWTEMKASGKAV
ncbi:MAG TPA: hypothetical protein EYP10_11770, partial [Armatimonadetes bacterium]|nr:hypothetical protein [Armatimonadota bacterium]